jgi:hypothetical protein
MKAKVNEYWVVRMEAGVRRPDNGKTIVRLDSETMVYECGDEQGWSIDHVIEWIRKVRL